MIRTGQLKAVMARSAPRRKRALPAFLDQGVNLTSLTPSLWDVLPEEQRQQLLRSIDKPYKQYLESLYNTADVCVDRYNELTRNHRQWRRTAIIGSGVLAILNFAAVKKDFEASTHGVLAIVAAVAALIIAVLANLETFSNSAEKAQTFRESRELFLDAAQEFDRVWTVYVVALGDSIEAYANAAELYKRIVAADGELRGKFKELSKQG